MRIFKHFILFVLVICAFASANGNSSIYTNNYMRIPHNEMRAVWLTTIGGLDWPHSYARSNEGIERQKSELIDILNKLKSAGINTVIMQSRVRATTIFQSDMEPWDGCLSGNPGKSPGYDALSFAIEQCHKRGMQLHAWVVTIPVGKWNGAGCKALRKKFPNAIKKIGDEGYMNPENATTGDYLATFCADIVSRYDVDGIHLDYIRYPETWGKIKDKNKGRANITQIVKKIHDAVKAKKQWVMMSCSPIGKYADLPRQWSHGWNARDVVCQDAAQWLADDLMDALFPMMYFRDENFYPFALDWKERSSGKIIAPGLGIYFMHPKEKNWPLIDISREMYVLRQNGEGFCFFRNKFFIDNTKGLFDFVQNELCLYPATVPAMTWYGFPKPDAPQQCSVDYDMDGKGVLSWAQGKDNSDGDYLRYNIYASASSPVDITDARNFLATSITSNTMSVVKGLHYAVTAVDRYGNESAPVGASYEIKYNKEKMARVRELIMTSHHSSKSENRDSKRSRKRSANRR